jgi:hypothetical protein
LLSDVLELLLLLPRFRVPATPVAGQQPGVMPGRRDQPYFIDKPLPHTSVKIDLPSWRL